MIAVLVISALNFCLILLLTCCSGYRKGIEEDDGFWENYNRYRVFNWLITLSLFAILVLSVPVTYEFVIVMLETIDELQFFQDKMPLLDGCLDDFSIKKAIDVSKTRTFDQLVMHFI